MICGDPMCESNARGEIIFEETDCRPTCDQYFMDVAWAISKRGSCDRAQVGAVIVKNNRIIAAGYNGAVVGDKTCISHGHIMIDGHCCRTIHAEVNAILQCAKTDSGNTQGATIYTTHRPCINCLKTIIQSEISTIYYSVAYGEQSDEYNRLLEVSGIKIAKIW